MSYDVYAIGNALTDIQARISDDLVTELRFAKGIMTLVDEETQIRVLNSLDGAETTRCAGGSGANTVAGIADFGGKVAYAAKVGDDEIGDFFLQDMRSLGVEIEVPQASDGQSGTCVILITPDAERTMLTHLGVSASLSPEDVSEEEIKQADYVYIEGYLFSGEPTKSAALHCIDVAVRNGVKVAFTVSDPFLIHQFRDEFLKLIEGPVDLLFCNLEEARALTTLNDPIECAQELHQHCSNVAMTLGANGSIVMHGGEVIPIEGVSVDAIDTTGAGDMYAAGVLYGVTNGLTWKQSGHLASHAAARIVSQMGARLKKPFTEAEVNELAGMV
ncbi:adenosine kinase [Stratiformator vulcanicus]|uniref:5-dehydro-2-deoxygluconokinase n=1 Tax=Stratiformator vulcanicus TaxID=2527980 RepID=A0A517R7H4_9PLAN|nr:adenosine kinase [Stratiformator vulcanicus]QDT39836.1 5-dehydro-2-deoxygluconokinase [Stratiformator vulcanicus]